jgi:hypothetical protein
MGRRVRLSFSGRGKRPPSSNGDRPGEARISRQIGRLNRPVRPKITFELDETQRPSLAPSVLLLLVPSRSLGLAVGPIALPGSGSAPLPCL